MMNRGDHLEAIFKDDKDREIFLKTLEQACVSSGWKAHSFVLMGNHYHLLIETTRATLVKGMQYLNSTYTVRYNVRHKTRGHLFQGRYKALLVDGDESGYFLTVSDYIHLNPVRMKGASRVRTLKDLLSDRWSSSGWLSGSRKGRPEWLRWERVYGELGLENWRSRSRREYREHLESRVAEARGDTDSWKKIRRGWCLGSERFVERMKEKLEELSLRPRREATWNDVAVEELEQDRAARFLKAGAKALGHGKGKRMRRWERLLLARWVRQRTSVSAGWLAQQLGMRTRGGLSHGIYLAGRRMGTDRALGGCWRKLENLAG